MESEPKCILCGEDFSLQDEDTIGWHMGQLREIKISPANVPNIRIDTGENKLYLCGNCFFDLTD